MKNKTLPKLFGIWSLIAATILPSYGQTSDRVAANIPFDFVVAGIMLPSGQYTLSPISDHALRIQGGDGTNYALVLTAAVSGRKADDFGQLLFNCYGDRCFLSQVWAAGSDVGREVMKSRSEKQLAKKPTGQEVAVLTAKPRS